MPFVTNKTTSIFAQFSIQPMTWTSLWGNLVMMHQCFLTWYATFAQQFCDSASWRDFIKLCWSCKEQNKNSSISPSHNDSTIRALIYFTLSFMTFVYQATGRIHKDHLLEDRIICNYPASPLASFTPHCCGGIHPYLFSIKLGCLVNTTTPIQNWLEWHSCCKHG